MTERELERMKDLAIPASRETAKRAALDAAMAVYEKSNALAAGAPLGVSQAPMQDSAGSAEEIHPQGNIIPLRQTETSTRKRSFLMYLSTRQAQALAASVAALVVAAPLAFQQLNKVGLQQPTFNDIATSMKSPEPTVALKTPQPSAISAPREQGAASSDETKLAVGETGKKVEAPASEAAPAQITPLTASPGVADARESAPIDEPKMYIPPPRYASARSRTENMLHKELRGENPYQNVETAPMSPETASRLGLGSTANEMSSAVPERPQIAASDAVKQKGDDNVFIHDLGSTLDSHVKFTGQATLADPANPSQLGRLSLGRQSQASDNTAILVAPAPATTPAEGKIAGLAPPPQAASPVDGLGAAGGYANMRTRGDVSTAAPAPQDTARLNAELGKRMLERDASMPAAADPSKPNPYSWMGRVEQEKAIVLEESHDKFDAKDINPVKQVAAEPVSTFSIDVDSASYSFVRRALNAGHLPPKDAVRVEEMINYFPYAYPAPDSAETPFKPAVTVMPSPWNPKNKLVHVAIKGYDLSAAERPRANIVLLMDVSGSMEPEDRLPLVKNAFRMLVDELKPDDTISIVTYASGSGIALEPTKVADKWKILSAIDRLGAGGSTAGAAGIADAYRLAEAGFDKSAVNRIILATDGDFNVGITDQNELKSYIERKRQSGIFLSILGVGQGNHNDALMQTLAQNGNGTAAYVDTLNEARKVLVDESSSTLFTIAKDVKVQIEWNPARVAEYRLIGYETRNLRREDFNNDKVDAGDIGSGHTVTAIYEVTPVGSPQLNDDLRYGNAAAKATIRDAATPTTMAGELGFLKLRYKKPNEDVSQLITVPLTDAMARANLNEVPVEQRFSVAVAAFGQLMKGEPYTQGYTFDNVLELAQSARGNDPFGYRNEFLNLVRLAKTARP
jgi:Ca-activated chloride channel homolog